MLSDSIFELLLLVMQGIATLTPPKIPDFDEPGFESCEDVLVAVLELLRVLFVFGLLVELLPGLLGRLKNIIFRHSRRLGLRFIDLHRRRPLFDTKVCITLRSNEVALNLWSVRSGHRARLTTYV